MGYIDLEKNNNDQPNTTSRAFLNVISQMNIDTQDVFQEKYQQLWQEASDENALLSLLLCDIDLFDLYTDNYSEQSTSFMLLVVALALKNVCQEHGCLLGHYHNHEFMVLLKGGDESDSEMLADALRKAVAASKIEHKYSELSDIVTLSVGISSVYPTSLKQMMEKAEQALISAKATAINTAHPIDVKVEEHSNGQSQIIEEFEEEQSSSIVTNQTESLNRSISLPSTELDTSSSLLTQSVEQKIEQSNPHEIEHSSASQSLPVKKQRFSALKAFISKSQNKNELVPKSSDIDSFKMSIDEGEKVLNQLPLTDSAAKKKEIVSDVLVDDVIKNDLLSVSEQNIEEPASNLINTIGKIESESVIEKSNVSVDVVNELEISSQLTKEENNTVAAKLESESNTVNDNDVSTAATINTKPQSAIEKHIAKLKTSDENQETKVEQNNPVVDNLEAEIGLVSDSDISSEVITVEETAVEENLPIADNLETESNTVNDNDVSTAAIVNTKPQSAIEKHIAALKNAKVKAEIGSVSDGDISEVTTKSKSQSAIEKHIARLKTSDENQEIKAKEDNTVADNLEVEISKVKDTYASDVITESKPQSAMEKHIAALKRAKIKASLNSTSKLDTTDPDKELIDRVPVEANLQAGNALSKSIVDVSIPSKADTPIANALKRKNIQQTLQDKDENKVNLIPTEQLDELNILSEMTDELEFAPSLEISSGLEIDELTLEPTLDIDDIKEKETITPQNNELELDLESISPTDTLVKKDQNTLPTAENNELALKHQPSLLTKKEQETPLTTDKNDPTPELQPSLSTKEDKKISQLTDLHCADESNLASALPKSDASKITEVSDVKSINSDAAPLEGPLELGGFKIHEEKKQGSSISQHLLTLNIGEQRAFDSKLATLWQDCCEENDFLSMFTSEIDFFTSYVEHYGKAESEKALMAIAAAINKACDKQDVFVFYLGNGCFSGLLKGGNGTKALRISEKICSRVVGLSIQHQLSKVSDVLTVSIGLTRRFPSDMKSAKELQDESDSALNMAIFLGRNQVSL